LGVKGTAHCAKQAIGSSQRNAAVGSRVFEALSSPSSPMQWHCFQGCCWSHKGGSALDIKVAMPVWPVGCHSTLCPAGSRLPFASCNGGIKGVWSLWAGRCGGCGRCVRWMGVDCVSSGYACVTCWVFHTCDRYSACVCLHLSSYVYGTAFLSLCPPPFSEFVV
jgi:hypothetical protein